MTAKVAIVSGGSRGLGKGFVEALLGAGYRVATFSRSPSEFTDGLQRNPEYQGRFLHQSLDLSHAKDLQGFVKRVVTEFGRLDVLVNNAGIARDGLLALGFVPQEASAYWVYRPVTRWDPCCGHYVTYQERCWVPDPCPAPYHAQYRGKIYHHGHYHPRPWRHGH